MCVVGFFWGGGGEGSGTESVFLFGDGDAEWGWGWGDSGVSLCFVLLCFLCCFALFCIITNHAGDCLDKTAHVTTAM